MLIRLDAYQLLRLVLQNYAYREFLLFFLDVEKEMKSIKSLSISSLINSRQFFPPVPIALSCVLSYRGDFIGFYFRMSDKGNLWSEMIKQRS